MASIKTLREGAYTLYELRDGDTFVTVTPERGAMALSFRVGSTSVFYLERDSFLDPTRNIRGGMPVLFPICGPLKDGRYLVEGKPHAMPQHGLARLHSWDVTDSGAAETAWLTLELAASSETLPAYPWRFKVRLRYMLGGGALTVEQSYHNYSDTAMPVQVGFHPYFSAPDREALELDIPADSYQDMITWETHRFAQRVDWSRESNDLFFGNVAAQRATVTDRAQGLRVELEYTPLFRHLVLWSVKDKPFYCLEPWTAPRFAMNTGDDLVWVKPGEELSATVSVRAVFM